MANQRSTFAKRRREQELQDKARAKQERRTAKKDEQRTTKGPQIAWDEAHEVTDNALPADGTTTPGPSDDTTNTPDQTDTNGTPGTPGTPSPSGLAPPPRR